MFDGQVGGRERAANQLKWWYHEHERERHLTRGLGLEEHEDAQRASHDHDRRTRSGCRMVRTLKAARAMSSAREREGRMSRREGPARGGSAGRRNIPGGGREAREKS